jgi:hypothetical protein
VSDGKDTTIFGLFLGLAVVFLVVSGLSAGSALFVSVLLGLVALVLRVWPPSSDSR